jgi:transcriptional regulator GlxA family with amidase domain
MAEMPAAAPSRFGLPKRPGTLKYSRIKRRLVECYPTDSDRIRIALTFARERLAEPLPIERLAEAANLSVRQFGRAFRRETGETPAKAVERLRVEAARMRLLDGAEPVEQIARAVGLNDPDRMRRAFIKIYGQPPQAVRRMNRHKF